MSILSLGFVKVFSFTFTCHRIYHNDNQKCQEKVKPEEEKQEENNNLVQQKQVFNFP